MKNRDLTTTSHKAKAARGIAATVALVGATAVVGDFKSVEEFLWWATGSLGAGAAVFLIIQGGEKLIHGALPSSIKYYASLVLGFAVPVGAYLALCYWLHATAFDRNQMFAAIVVGAKFASTLHWEGERMEVQAAQEEAIAKRLSAFNNPGGRR